MSRHEGVSCDSCLKGNFRGKRYKCLICYDYDLCATCYEAGATTTRHTADHPVQCILTRTDFELYYGGEALSQEQPQAYTCPFCGRMGFTETTLQEHMTAEHADSSLEVVCPICASLPGGDPNLVTDDFAAHLTLEHRAPRDLDEPLGGIRHVRRIQHPRGAGGTRTRRSNMHFQSAGGSSLSGLSTGSRETMDPIAELLSQLSSVRSRAAAAQSVSSQLQQLEMQLQTTRQQLERLPRRQEAVRSVSAAASSQPGVMDYAGAIVGGNSDPAASGGSGSTTGSNSQFLLARYGDPELSELDKQNLEADRADRSVFVQELLLSSLSEGLRLDDSGDESTGAFLSQSLDTVLEVSCSGSGAATAAAAKTANSPETQSTATTSNSAGSAPSPLSSSATVSTKTTTMTTLTTSSSNGGSSTSQLHQAVNGPMNVISSSGNGSPPREGSASRSNPTAAATGALPNMVKHNNAAATRDNSATNKMSNSGKDREPPPPKVLH